MKIIDENNLKILIAEDDYFLKAKDDEYQESYLDEFKNEIREHVPY